MIRLRASYSNSLAAAVRGYLGLSQTELGRWLGVAMVQVSDVEAGRKRLSAAPNAHLELLADCLPAALPALTAYEAPAPPPAAPPHGPARLARVCAAQRLDS